MSNRFSIAIALIASAALIGMPHVAAGQKLIASYAGSAMAAASGGTYVLSGTAGQPAVGSSGMDPEIHAGFWYATNSAVSVENEAAPRDSSRPYTLELDDPFPNPVSREVSIEYETPRRSSGLDVSIFDVTGRRVLSVSPTESGLGRRSITIDTSSLAPGLYFIRLTDNWTQVSRKMIVAR